MKRTKVLCKSKLRIFLVLWIALLFGKAGVTQNVNGRVVDNEGVPLPFAAIVSYALPDTTMIEGEISDTLGLFSLSNPCDILKISFVGYESIWINRPKGNIGDISLHSETKLLQEVNVLAQKPMIINLPDRIVVEVQNSILANTLDGMEMLRLTPGVWVDPLDGISVLGKGTPIVYINNHRVHSISEIESLDPQFIKSVDVIDTPSAKYEADAVAVIKITTIRRNDFYNVRIGGVLSWKKAWSENGRIDVNFSRKKFSGNLYYQLGESRTLPVEHNHYSGADGYLINFDYYDRRHYGNSHNIRASAEYAITPSQSIGWQGNASLGKTRNKMNKTVCNETPDAYDFNVQSGLEGYNNLYYSTLYYNWDIDSKGQKLNATFDFTHSDYDRCDTFRNVPVNASYLDYVLNSNSNTGSNDVYIGKVDYSLPLGEMLKLNIGSKYYAILGDNRTIVNGFTNYENHYQTDERNIAGYAEVLWTISEKWSAIIGIRGERMHRSNAENGMPKLDFTEQGLYPRINIQYIPTQSYSIRASYSKTVARPSFSALNPSLSMDSLSNNFGNPDLINSFTHNLSIFFSFPHNIGATFNYNRMVNPIIYDFQSSLENQNLLEGRWYNGNPYNSYSFDIWSNLTPTKQWYLYLDMYYNQGCYMFEVDGVAIVNNKPRFGGMIANTIELPKDWTIAVNFDASTSYSAQTAINESLCNLYVQMTKKMLNKALNITLSFSDILGTNVSRQQSLLRGKRYTYFDSGRRGATLNVSYKFGKAKKSFRSRTVGDAERQRLTN